MWDPEQEIRRKVEVRRFAEKHLGDESPSEWANSAYASFPPEIRGVFLTIEKQLCQAKESSWLDIYFPVQAHKRYFRGAVIFFKKAIRKLIKIFLGWFILPLLDRQNRFNASILQAAQAMQDTMVEQQKQLIELQETIRQIQSGAEESHE